LRHQIAIVAWLSLLSLIAACDAGVVQLGTNSDGGINGGDGLVSDHDGGSDATNHQPDAALPVDAQTNPCDGVDCGPHGTCEVSGSTSSCNCETGYHADGLSCVQDQDPCQGVTCGSNAHCASGACVCDDGYQGDPTTGCTSQNEDSVRAELVAIAKAELGNCEGVVDRPYMDNQPGLWCYDFVAWVYQQCSYPLPSPISLPQVQVSNMPNGWQAKAGDLIKFTIQHYGMVDHVSANGQTIYTVEGNVNSCVTTRVVSLSSIEYFGTLENQF